MTPRITLVKKDADAKSINDSLMSRLRPIYRGSASALAALAGAENGSSKKDEGNAKVYFITRVIHLHFDRIAVTVSIMSTTDVVFN